MHTVCIYWGGLCGTNVPCTLHDQDNSERDGEGGVVNGHREYGYQQCFLLRSFSLELIKKKGRQLKHPVHFVLC